MLGRRMRLVPLSLLQLKEPGLCVKTVYLFIYLIYFFNCVLRGLRVSGFCGN